MKAAVSYEHNAPLTVEEIQIDAPKQPEVLATRAIVEEVGADETGVKPGDHVSPLSCPSCGRCNYCFTGRPQLCYTAGLELAQR